MHHRNAIFALFVGATLAGHAHGQEVLIDNSTPGFYNDALGQILDGSDKLFPTPWNGIPDDPILDPTYDPVLEAPPISAAAQAILGDWLGNPAALNSNWVAQGIPLSWPLQRENAIVYGLDLACPMDDVEIRIGVDNGAFVWLNGTFLKGQLASGGAVPGELTIDVGRVEAGMNYVQILRTDNGGGTGFDILATGAPVFDVTGKVFFDIDEDGVQDLPIGDTGEVGISGFRLCLQADGEPTLETSTIDSEDPLENGSYAFLSVPKIEGVKYTLLLKGPTGLEGRFGFINDGTAGAFWLLTSESETVCIDPFASESASAGPIALSDLPVDFGVLSFGQQEDGEVSPNLTVQNQEFWCNLENKQAVLEILATRDPEWRMVLNGFCFQFSCLTEQFEADGGLLKFSLTNGLPAALNLLCRFFEKENCGDHLMHDFSENVALTILSALFFFDDEPDRIFLLDPDTGALISLAQLSAGTAALFCNPLALDPFQDGVFLQSILGCMNEWDDAANDGVFGVSEQPLRPNYGDEGDR